MANVLHVMAKSLKSLGANVPIISIMLNRVVCGAVARGCQARGSTPLPPVRYQGAMAGPAPKNRAAGTVSMPPRARVFPNDFFLLGWESVVNIILTIWDFGVVIYGG